MSWVVENLLRNRVKLRTSPDITNDEYLDLLMVESTIKKLTSHGAFTKKEVDVMNAVGSGKSLSDVSKELGIGGRGTVDVRLERICSVIAYKLGGEFTDDGYLTKLTQEYSLSGKQVSTLRKFMKSTHKRDIPRYIRGED